jgi:hypothetical protein
MTILILIVFAPSAETLILVEFFFILASHYKDNEKFWEEIIVDFLYTLHTKYLTRQGCWVLFTVGTCLPSSCLATMEEDTHTDTQTHGHADIQAAWRSRKPNFICFKISKVG